MTLDTRKAALKGISSRAASLQARIIALLKDVGPGTPDELAMAMKETVLAVRPRITELKNQGQVKDTGLRRTNASGKSAMVVTLAGLLLAITLSTGAGAQDTTKQILPALPDSIPSQLGWVRVVKVETDLQCGSRPALGCFQVEERVIYVHTGISRVQEWQTLEHERVHMILWDAGLYAVIGKAGITEQIADVLGSARVTEKLQVKP